MRSIILIGIGLATLVVAMLLTFYFSGEEEAVAPQASVQEEVVKQEPKAQPVKNSPVEEEPEIQNVLPSFDVVRINPEGDIVMAGRATPGASVEVLDEETVIGDAGADTRGEWVFLPTSPLKPGSRQLRLKATNPDGSVAYSADTVLFDVPEQPNEGALALSMPNDSSGQVKALQVPGAEELALSIDAVSYDQTGKLTLSGKAPIESTIFLYLDDIFLGNTTSDVKGFWSISPVKIIVPGVYTLRADHVDENKKVLNRVQIPFARSEDMMDIPEDRKIVVQPGNSLWRIARRIYGTGFDYTVIFKANKDQIADPNLIYPGQVFELPEGVN